MASTSRALRSVEQSGFRTFTASNSPLGAVARKVSARSRLLFSEVDRPALRPLPAERFDLSEWSRATVNIDYHIQYEHSFYSVPYQLVRQTVEVRATPLVIEIFSKGVRVAMCAHESHMRR
jgi:hypothetical protein